MNFFMEVAKLRAARLLWAKMIKRVRARRTRRAMSLRTHCQTSGVEPGGPGPLQQRHAHLRGGAGRGARTHAVVSTPTPSTRRWRSPPDFSARIARNTQLYIQQETGYLSGRSTPGVGRATWSGSRSELATKRHGVHIEEVEKLGGMAKRHRDRPAQGMRIEEAAARTQARIDSGRQTIVGVNKHRRGVRASGWTIRQGRQLRSAREAGRAPGRAQARRETTPRSPRLAPRA